MSFSSLGALYSKAKWKLLEKVFLVKMKKKKKKQLPYIEAAVSTSSFKWSPPTHSQGEIYWKAAQRLSPFPTSFLPCCSAAIACS